MNSNFDPRLLELIDQPSYNLPPITGQGDPVSPGDWCYVIDYWTKRKLLGGRFVRLHSYSITERIVFFGGSVILGSANLTDVVFQLLPFSDLVEYMVTTRRFKRANCLSGNDFSVRLHTEALCLEWFQKPLHETGDPL